MPKEISKEELTERAQVVRAFEASCKIEYPSDEERAFRVALMKRLGSEWNLRELRDKTIALPTNANRPAR